MGGRLALLIVAWLAIETQQPRAPIVQLIRDAHVDVVVESLQIGADGTTTILSKQTLPRDGATSIAIVDTPEHWLRFTTARQKPLTIPAGDLLATDVWHVQVFQPRDHLSLWGAAGHVPRVPTGATLITGETAACATAQTFRLGLRMTIAVGASPFLQTMATDDVARCRWIFLGLAPTEYEAALRNPQGSSGRREFRVVTGETTHVLIPPPLVTVSGVATLNKQPVPEGNLQFRNAGGVSSLARLEADGSYHMALDEDGRYSVTLRVPYKAFKPMTASFVRGTNTFDIEIDDAEADSRLTVRVTGIDRSLPTGIEIRGRDGLISGTIPAGGDTFERRGLPFGLHRVSAHQAEATSDWHGFELTAAQPTVTADLALTRATRSITLRYVDGEPVTSAGFSNTSARPEEITPGTYSLAGVAPDTELVIRPPSGAPLCKVVPANGDVEAIAFPGRSITLRFQNRAVSVDEVRIRAEGSDCSVPLARFLKSSLKPGPSQTTQLELLNAPPDEMLTIFTRNGGFRVTVPEDGVVLVPGKQ
jgi:hypothetical protein